MDPLILLAVALALLAAACAAAGVYALRGRRFVGGLGGVTLALLLLAVGALCATLSVATRGYRALTHEEVAAVVETRPTGEQTFRAVFRLPDGTRRSFRILGDQLYVDARIVKWKPLLNVLGLHTAYELDRVGGRYRSLEDARAAPRTVYRLGEDRPVDLFELKRRLPLLDPLVDAEYGSATYLAVRDTALLEVRVSTSGLLIRRSDRGAGAEP